MRSRYRWTSPSQDRTPASNAAPMSAMVASSSVNVAIVRAAGAGEQPPAATASPEISTAANGLARIDMAASRQPAPWGGWAVYRPRVR